MPLITNSIGNWDTHIMQHDLPGRLRVPAHLLFITSKAEAGRTEWDNKRRHAPRTCIRGLRHQNVNVTCSSTGDKLLRSVENVVISIANSRRFHRRRI